MLAWASTIEVCWHTLEKHKSSREVKKQAKMEDCFRFPGCHVGILGSGDNTINWGFILLLYFLDVSDLI
jgi:hypothetical protein